MYHQIASGKLPAVINMTYIDFKCEIRFNNNSTIETCIGSPSLIEYRRDNIHEILFDYDTDCDIIKEATSLMVPYFGVTEEDMIRKIENSTHFQDIVAKYRFNRHDYDEHQAVWGQVPYFGVTEEMPLKNSSEELDKFLNEFRVV